MIPFSCLDWQVTIRLRSYAFLRGFLGVTWKEMSADFPGSMVLAVENGGLFNNANSKQVQRQNVYKPARLLQAGTRQVRVTIHPVLD